MRNAALFLFLIIPMGSLGFYYAHYVVESINYVATWGQALFLAEPIAQPIPVLPDWANIIIGMIAGLIVQNIYTTIKSAIRKKIVSRT